MRNVAAAFILFVAGTMFAPAAASAGGFGGGAYGATPAYSGSSVYSPLGGVNPYASLNTPRGSYSYPSYNRGTMYAAPPVYSAPINSSMHLRRWTMRRGN